MIRLVYDSELGEADLAQADDGGIGEGDELATAVLISLFTDRLVDNDELPDGVEDRAGWWGDVFPDEDGAERRPIGSRLWLLEHEAVQPTTPVRARAYALEALEWMVEDGVAAAVEATATRNDRGRVDLRIVITLTDGARRTYEVPDAL